jgi:hypothetical protein
VEVKNGRAAHIAHFSDALVLSLPHNLLAAGLEAGLRIRIKSGLGPNSIGSVDPDPDPGGQKRPTKVEKNFYSSCF